MSSTLAIAALTPQRRGERATQRHGVKSEIRTSHNPLPPFSKGDYYSSDT